MTNRSVEMDVGNRPFGVVLSPDGKAAYVGVKTAR
ncbi:MAG: hypothetical protein QOF31_4327 [Mycobacterium sp.]|jgi:DNA-binding beta-propeller fold protein YncE|nr:hypothetical protein [Mycobacterium sp.]